MIIGSDYIKTIINGMKTWVKKQIRVARPDWNQNDPNASGYIDNRPGGYDVAKEETVQVQVDPMLLGSYPYIWLKWEGGADHYAVKIDDTPITREQLQRATLTLNGSNLSGLEMCNAGDGLYYLANKNALPITSVLVCNVFVVAKPGNYPIFGNFLESGLGTYVIMHQVSGSIAALRMTYPRTVTTPQRIPSKYLDAMPGLTIDRESFEPMMFPTISAIDDEGKPTHWWAIGLSSVRNMIVPPVTADDNGKVLKVVYGAWAAEEDGIIQSSTPDSTKKFKLTVDDSGTISATEVVE